MWFLFSKIHRCLSLPLSLHTSLPLFFPPTLSPSRTHLITSMTLLSNFVMGWSGLSKNSGARGRSSRSLRGVTAEIWMDGQRNEGEECA